MAVLAVSAYTWNCDNDDGQIDERLDRLHTCNVLRRRDVAPVLFLSVVLSLVLRFSNDLLIEYWLPIMLKCKIKGGKGGMSVISAISSRI